MSIKYLSIYNVTWSATHSLHISPLDSDCPGSRRGLEQSPERRADSTRPVSPAGTRLVSPAATRPVSPATDADRTSKSGQDISAIRGLHDNAL